MPACCHASSSVGAINADCMPLRDANTIAAAATSVLPLPTSPCSSRFIGTSRLMSFQISRITRRCAPRERKGQRRFEVVEQPGGNAQAPRVVVALALVSPQLRRGCQAEKLCKDEAVRARAAPPQAYGARGRLDMLRPATRSRAPLPAPEESDRSAPSATASEILLDDRRDLAACKIFRRAIDRDELPAILFVFAELRVMRDVDDCSRERYARRDPGRRAACLRENGRRRSDYGRSTSRRTDRRRHRADAPQRSPGRGRAVL